MSEVIHHVLSEPPNWQTRTRTETWVKLGERRKNGETRRPPADPRTPCTTLGSSRLFPSSLVPSIPQMLAGILQPRQRIGAEESGAIPRWKLEYGINPASLLVPGAEASPLPLLVLPALTDLTASSVSCQSPLPHSGTACRLPGRCLRSQLRSGHSRLAIPLSALASFPLPPLSAGVLWRPPLGNRDLRELCRQGCLFRSRRVEDIQEPVALGTGSGPLLCSPAHSEKPFSCPSVARALAATPACSTSSRTTVGTGPTTAASAARASGRAQGWCSTSKFPGATLQAASDATPTRHSSTRATPRIGPAALASVAVTPLRLPICHDTRPLQCRESGVRAPVAAPPQP
ncbi:uncharacterized protein LOC123632070 [Lemur catta]|uniref:uncharacterized protein LOC123632070 n=1 Tax=Lemur catta TaxID=9447 RepID=UPI001E268946|nr:uncharacterized protein LOC123632070 [Lemur catta]